MILVVIDGDRETVLLFCPYGPPGDAIKAGPYTADKYADRARITPYGRIRPRIAARGPGTIIEKDIGGNADAA